jgi:hypothetical protein
MIPLLYLFVQTVREAIKRRLFGDDAIVASSKSTTTH